MTCRWCWRIAPLSMMLITVHAQAGADAQAGTDAVAGADAVASADPTDAADRAVLEAIEQEIAAFHLREYGTVLDPELVAYHARELARVRAHNEAVGASWTAGPTGLVRYSEEELAGMLGLRFSEPEQRRAAQLRGEARTGTRLRGEARTGTQLRGEARTGTRLRGEARVGEYDTGLLRPLREDLPETFSWYPGGVTGIRDQGNCGSCWDFAALAALEAVIRIYGGEIFHLSEQQILSCATPGWGCNGGNAAIAWGHVRDHGSVSNACMFYRADHNYPCEEDECEPIAAVKEWIDIPNNVDAIKAAVYEYGPVTTGFTVYSDFYQYTDGCYEREGTAPVNHLIAIIGWDDTACDGEGAWEIKNSWGMGWGINGRGFIKYGACNIGKHTQQVFYYPATDLEWVATDVEDDVTGDGDAWLDPDETAGLSVQIRNGILAEGKTGIAGVLSSPSPSVDITGSEAVCTDLEPHQGATLTPPFELTVDADTPVGETIWFYLDLAADGTETVTDSFSLVIGDVPVLLVDDDAGSVADPFFRASLETNDLGYRVWDTAAFGAPPSEVLGRYPVVLWVTGLDGSISDAEQSALIDYTTGGGSLLASGQDIGWFMNEYQEADPEDQAFYENILRATYLVDDAGYRHLEGLPGDPITEGLAFDLGGGSGSCAQDYPSAVAPRAGAQPMLAYADDWYGAVRYDDEYRLAYFAFGLEAINDEATRDELLLRTIRWLAPDVFDNQAPQIAVVHPNGGEVWWEGEEVTIEWIATDDTLVEWVSLLLSRDGGDSFAETLADQMPNHGSLSWTVEGETSQQCLVWAEACDDRGWTSSDISDGLFTIVGSTVGINDAPPGSPGTPGSPTLPAAFAFRPGEPNPFMTATRIELALPIAEEIRLGIYDLSGRRVRLLSNGQLPAGVHHFVWDGADHHGHRAAGGVYFIRSDRPSETRDARLLLLR